MSDAAAPPAVVVDDDNGAELEADWLRREGWSVQHGFVLPGAPWDLGADRRACVGAILDEVTAADALLAAARGVALVVVLRVKGETCARFLADLSRVAAVETRTATTGAGDLPLDEQQRQLLELIGSGRTMAEAASELYLSQRTAERKLGTARRALGVATTAEAVARVRTASS